MARLDRSFFARPTLDVARDLLGCELVCRECAGVISETEAYIGPDDPACHAASGRTPRNEVLWGPPGHAYVYFTYGMHHLLNIVTEAEAFPAAVLIRAVIPTRGMEAMRARRQAGPARRKAARQSPVADAALADGPSKLCEAMGIDLSANGLDMCRKDSPLYILKTGLRPEFSVSGRIGISKGSERPWRFVSKAPA